MFAIYQLCKRKQYYTYGTCKEYDAMLENVKCENVIPEITACDIYFHSDIDTRPDLSTIIQEVLEIYKNYGD